MRASTTKRGFLLIEILVAIGIFTIVMLICMTSVIALLNANKKNQAMKSVINNLNLAVDSMAKNIAVGTLYYCGHAPSNYPGNYEGGEDCAQTPEDEIAFLGSGDRDNNGTPDIIRYKFENNRIYRSIDGANPQNFVAITAPEVFIEEGKFFVYDTERLVIPTSPGGNPSGDTRQPRVTIIINGYTGANDTVRSQFHVESTVTQRTLDVVYD